VRVRARGNSGTEFRELGGDGTGRNCTEFQELLRIPELHGIPSNSGIAWNSGNLMELGQ